MNHCYQKSKLLKHSNLQNYHVKTVVGCTSVLTKLTSYDMKREVSHKLIYDPNYLSKPRRAKHNISKILVTIIVDCYPISNKQHQRYCVSRRKLLTSGDIEVNPGPVSNANNTVSRIPPMVFKIIRCWWCR